MTILFAPRGCLEHAVPTGHPERPARLEAIHQAFEASGLLADLDRRPAAAAPRQALARVHDEGYLDGLAQRTPAAGLARLDADTALGPGSLAAATLAAGAAVAAVDAVVAGPERRAFCAVRPPGHHAEEGAAMGFCLLNGVAVAAAHALASHGLERVAILDFDVHHGNGTVAAFMEEPRVLVCSSFQFPHYPYRLQTVERPNIVNTPLPAGTSGLAFRQALERDWLPALEQAKPDLVLVSAGFDAHRDDPLGDLLLTEADFAWATQLIVAAAEQHAGGRVVSVLEGGYDLAALARCAEAHVVALGGG